MSARLCQRLSTECRDYNETFSPVVRYDSLRVLLAHITQEDLEMVSFDIRSAFLYSELREKIFMEMPQGFKANKNANGVVCALKKSLEREIRKVLT